jgi:3-phosphoshikimate 1-carboxyvinyltransferase
MEVRIRPHGLTGTIAAVPSKSVAHRMLICAALAEAPCTIVCSRTSEDIDATAACLRELGAKIVRTETGFEVEPIVAPKAGAVLDCGESGSTLRFMLPVAAALGVPCTFVGHGRLGERPLEPLATELQKHGCTLSSDHVPLELSGKLDGGVFTLPGDVSSQYMTGLLLAAPVLDQNLKIRVQEPVESWPYIEITLDVMRAFDTEIHVTHERVNGVACTVLSVEGKNTYLTPERLVVGGDWSNSAFWLAAGALGSDIVVTNLNNRSRQGDRAILGALALLGANVVREASSTQVFRADMRATAIDVSNTPDLTPPIAAVAATCEGVTRITGTTRLRIKESDRIESVTQTLAALGADIHTEGDDIVIRGRERLAGGDIDARNDHRIAMMAAIAATVCDGPVTIRGAQCVNKSYPEFFSDYAALGGDVEILEG